MNKIKEIRRERGLSQETLARQANISRKYLSSLENQKSTPSIAVALRLSNVLDVAVDKLFIEDTDHNGHIPDPLRYIDLFCGIGGFRYAVQNACKSPGIAEKCVFSSDIDKYAQVAYEANFGELPCGDITKVDAADIPDFDILFAGFPCQSFSIIGLRKGFEDTTRGTLFFDIARILSAKQPQAFMLENVKNLAGHDNGKTLNTILSILRDELGYYVDYKILNALDFGLPQKRERIIILGSKTPFVMDWNFDVKDTKTLSDILQPDDEIDPKHYASEEIVKKRKARHVPSCTPSVWHENKSGNISSYPYSCALRAGASYNYLLVNGERRLTPREMLRLQGFPDSFKIVVSDTQTRKQAGNAVPVNMIQTVLEKFLPMAF